MNKKIGGVRVTLRPVAQGRPKQETIPTGRCVCGKSAAECAKWWDEQLGVKGHTADSQSGVSEYHRNIEAFRAALVRGEDPYCLQATARAAGYEPHWTPFCPPGSFSVPTSIQAHAQGLTQGGTIGTRKNCGSQSGSGSRDSTRGSGRRRRGKSV